MCATRLFSLDTLDKRLVRCSDAVAAKASPSLWNTWEFWTYGLIHAVTIPIMFKTAHEATSSENKENFSKFSHLLSKGWIGKYVDNSDLQYSGFRDNFFLLLLLIGLHQLLRHIIPIQRVKFDFWFGLFMSIALHGLGGLSKIMIILFVNYRISRHVSLSRLTAWAFGIGILFLNEFFRGYPLSKIYAPLGWLDGGILQNWEVFFKCTMMRMLSYTFDYREARQKVPLSDADYRNEESRRISFPRPLNQYSFQSYVAYCLYSPLYLAGPLITFNDYMAQSQNRLKTINWHRTGLYALRFFICMLTMEFLLHFIAVNAVMSTRAWKNDTPAQISMVGFFGLVHIWLKLLLPWRFFRMWSLIDGIDPPENMVRCVADNYSAASFWRSWHRSFHLWVVRYLYIPLGGSKRPIRNNLIIFAFVAIWHDIQLRLFIWGGLIVLFVMPELIASRMLPPRKFRHYWWFRYVAGFGAVINIWMMLIANLVGFGLGMDGICQLLTEMISTAAGLRFMILCSLLLSVGVQFMFELRQTEHRRGIDLKC